MDREARFDLRPSAILGVLMSAAAILVLISLFMLPILLAVRAFAAVWVLHVTFSVLWRDAWLRRPDSCTAVRCDAVRRALLEQRDGTQLGGQVCDDTLVTPWLILLNVRVEAGGRRSLALLPDSLPREDFRRL